MLAVAWGEALGVEMLCVADSAGDQPEATFPGGTAGLGGSLSGFPVPGISRQEHWSGLPFPSPMHESEK